MIVKTKAPCRISLFGGGTDLPVYSNSNSGIVLSMAINIYQHITIDTDGTGVGEIPENASPMFYKQILYKLGREDYIESKFDAMIESGLGSSASATVAIIGAVNKINGKRMTKNQVAKRAWEIETGDLGLYGGKQDQYASAIGGCNTIKFKDNVTVIKIPVRKARKLHKHLMLFYSGNNRKSNKIQHELKELSNDQIYALNSIKNTCIKAIDLLNKGKFEEIGYLLGLSWQYKKNSNSLVTNARIDKLHYTAMHSGAWGGKLCGSGGGGFMVFMADPKDHNKIIKEMEKIGANHYPFEIDWKGLQ